MRSFPYDEVVARGSIRTADVTRLRADVYGDGLISAEDAARIIELNAACPVQDASWSDFYIEAVTDFIVHQAAPEGYVTRENADWLTTRLVRDGRISLRSDLDLLINILEEARWAPPSLAAFCLAQVHKAVLTGEGPLRAAGSALPGTITDADVELVRRIIYAAGGDGNIAVTRAEAELLFAINDTLADEAANEAWTELFVKAIANLLLSASGYQVPTREEALSSEVWLDERGSLSPLAIVTAVAQSALAGVIGSYRRQSREEQAIARLERQRLAIVTAEEITADEAHWLAERLGSNGKLTANEDALIAFLAAEGLDLDPSLAEVIAGLRQAAA